MDGKWGYIGRDGALAIPPRFADARRFSEGLAAVRLDRAWGYVEHGGTLAIEARFVSADDFQAGRARVGAERNPVSGGASKWGYVDRTGQYIWRPTS